MEIPFAKEAYKRSRAFTPEQVVLNFLVEKDQSGTAEDADEQTMLVQRPGLDPYTSLPAPVQGLYAANNPSLNLIFAVAGNKLYSIAEGTSEALGDLGGLTDLSPIVANFDRVAVVSYPLFYLYGASADSTDPSFRSVDIPDGYKAVDVTMLNDYIVVACEDGTFYWLAPGDDEFDPLNFATAESSPDGLVGIATLNGNLVFFGTTTVEVWQPTGNADLPFQRTTGQDYARGCLARDTIQHFDNSILWVGEDAKVYRADYTPKKISTDGIDERLKLRSGDPSAWTFSYDGHLVYVLTIPGQGTFGYDVSIGSWVEFSSDGVIGWRPRVGYQTTDGWLCGDSQTGAVWVLSDSSTDDGAIIRRRASATVPLPSKPVRVDNLSLDVGCEGPCEWRVRWADADEDLDDQAWITLDATRAGADILTFYRMGAARSPYRTFQVEVTDPVVVRLSGARVGEAWR